MTTNTARNSAATADGIGRVGRSGGTSVLLQDLTRSFGPPARWTGCPSRWRQASSSRCLGRRAAVRRPRCASWPASRRPTPGRSWLTARTSRRCPPPAGTWAGVPELQPVPEHVGARQRGLRAPDAQDRCGRPAQAGRRPAGHGRARPPGPAVPASAVRRPAAARRAGPGAGHRAAGAAARRAAVRPGRQGTAAAARADPHPAAAARHHHPVRHPRPGGGPVDGGPGRRHAAGQAGADRGAGRVVQQPGHRVRSRVSRRDEPDTASCGPAGRSPCWTARFRCGATCRTRPRWTCWCARRA
jgi:hypothetical protein